MFRVSCTSSIMHGALQDHVEKNSDKYIDMFDFYEKANASKAGIEVPLGLQFRYTNMESVHIERNLTKIFCKKDIKKEL